jgi:hypothetical protein
MEKNLVKRVIDAGGDITPLLIPAELTNGTGLMNPSVMVKDGKITIIIRHVNYTFYHSEKKLFQHPFGPLTYLHPENDIHLRTWNWYCEIGDDFKVNKYHKIDTSTFDIYEPLWDFVGLEDARIIEWDNKLYLSGVRRDTTTNGVGRMELSEIQVSDEGVKEISRVRIAPPNDPNSYCEKNWMPIVDKPFHYVKWSNPTELVKVDPKEGTSQTLHLSETINLPRDLRGGSQVLPFKDGYFAITHEVDLFKSEEGRKDAVYYHRFIVWDKNFNIVKVTPEFYFMDAKVEFCIGLAEHGDDYLISFGFQDNAAYLLKAPKIAIENFIDGVELPVNPKNKQLSNDTLDALLFKYINASNNDDVNFKLGYYYHNIGQTASAVSYYLRAAERTDDNLIKYECLLRAGMCFESQGCRSNSVEGMLQHAIALMPHRPEGYYYLSRFYENAEKWNWCYFIASLGEKVSNRNPAVNLKTTLDYPGFYGIVFEKAVSAWWVGLCEESRNTFRYLWNNEPLNDIYRQVVTNNLNRINGW